MPETSLSSLERFVDHLAIRSVLEDEERAAILQLPFQTIALRSKQDFVQVDQEITFSCLVTAGLVGRFGQTAGGKRQITAFHIPGDMADLHSAVRPVGVGGLTALCATTIQRIPHAAIRAMATRYPAVAEAMWRECMLDTAVLMQWLVNIGRRDAPARLAHVLCEMAIRFGRDRQPALRFQFPVTQEQLGDACALTSVHVNRCLKLLGTLVTVRGGTVDVHDWRELVEAGDFDSTYLIADTAPKRQARLIAAV